MKRVFWSVLAAVGAIVLAAGLTFYLQPLAVNDSILRYKLWRQQVESHYVAVDGFDIHYYEAHPPRLPSGRPRGIPLVLVHGLGSRGEDWSPLIPTLAAQGFHVYVLDLLGFGRSPQPEVDYSMSLQEKTVVDFMDAVHLDHADIGGWSMGGWVSLKVAVDHPERVDRLVVFDSAGIYFPPTFDASLFIPTDSSGMDKLTRILTPAPRAMPPFVMRAAIRQLHRNGWVIERSVASMEAGKDLLDFRLHEIHKPTLIVWGGLDELIPMAVGESMHRKIADSSLLVIDGCGHLAPGECSRPVLKGMVEFLKAEPAVKGGERHAASVQP